MEFAVQIEVRGERSWIANDRDYGRSGGPRHFTADE